MSTVNVHYKIGFKSGAGNPAMMAQRFYILEEAQAAAQKYTLAGHGKHYVWKITTEEIQ